MWQHQFHSLGLYINVCPLRVQEEPLLSDFRALFQPDYIKMCLLNIICKWKLLIGCQGA